MISIIICHRNKKLLENIKSSISSTINVAYEIIVIDNSDNSHTIFSAYNEGVKRSKYSILCFTHEDILFYSDNWGNKVLTHFTDPQVGMIGVAGGKAQASVPSSWWYNHLFGKGAVNLLMSNSLSSGNDNSKAVIYHRLNKPGNNEKEEVVIVDGLWFCIRKSLFEKISFDEKTFSGFHLYDADISLQVREHAKNFIVYDILMQHLFSGKINNSYYEVMPAFMEKWKDQLPQQAPDLVAGFSAKYGWYALRYYLLDLHAKNFSKEDIKNTRKKYINLLKNVKTSYWNLLYYVLADVFGYKLTHSLFLRIEAIFGISYSNSYSNTEFTGSKLYNTFEEQ